MWRHKIKPQFSEMTWAEYGEVCYFHLYRAYLKSQASQKLAKSFFLKHLHKCLPESERATDMHEWIKQSMKTANLTINAAFDIKQGKKQYTTREEQPSKPNTNSNNWLSIMQDWQLQSNSQILALKKDQRMKEKRNFLNGRPIAI